MMGKTALLLLPVILICCFAISGCNNRNLRDSGINLSPPGIFPITEEDVGFSVMVAEYRNNVDDWETNASTLFLKEYTGVDVEYIVVPDLTRSRTVAVASGNMPDAFMGEMPAGEIMTWGPAGSYLALNRLIAEHAPTIRKNFREDPSFGNAAIAPDGNIYGLPSINDDLHGAFGNKIWINHEWLETLNLEMPDTLSDFKETLIAFRDGDPNGNGIRDEIPLSASIDGWSGEIPGAILNSFLYVNTQTHGLYQEDGTIRSSYTDPRYREALAYTADLYAEGLIDQAAFTQENRELVRLGESPGDVLLGAAAGGFWSVFTINGDESGRYQLYDLVPPLAGSEGFRTTGYYDNTLLNAFVITSSCQVPEVAIKWADYLASPEGAYNIQFGPEGIGWKRPPEGAVGLNGRPALFVRLSPPEGNQNWGFSNGPPRYQPASQRLGEMRAEPEEYYEASKLMTRLTTEVIEKYLPYKPDASLVLPTLYFSGEQITELSTIESAIDQIIREYAVKFSVGILNTSDDTDWIEYLKVLEHADLPRMLEIYQSAWESRYQAD